MTMSASTPPPGPPQAGNRSPAHPPAERYQVTIERVAAESADDPAARVSAMDLDRLPDRDGIRLLVDAEQLDRLRAAGLQVRVDRQVPIQPLDPDLIADDESVAGWLAERLPPTGGATDDGVH